MVLGVFSSLIASSYAIVDHATVDDVYLLQAAHTKMPPGCDSEVRSEWFGRLVKSCEVLAQDTYDFAHEAPVYIPSQNKVLFSSNRLGENAGQTIEILTVDLAEGKVEKLPERVWKDELVMANGGILDWKPRRRSRGANKVNSVLIASQGNMEKSGGIYRLNLLTYAVDLVVNASSWENQQFNSLNDLVMDPVSGAILFTDPIYGFAQGFRPQPHFPGGVWGFRPSGGEVRQLSDDFTRPNGIVFASRNTVLVTDSGMFPGAEFISEYTLLNTAAADVVSSDVDFSGPRNVYAMDVKRHRRKHIVGLSNKRILFTAAAGVPDGIKVDCTGNIYVGVGNGVAIYSKDGYHLGTVKTPQGCANLVLVPRGRRKSELVALCEKQIWRIQLNTRTCSLR